MPQIWSHIHVLVVSIPYVSICLVQHSLSNTVPLLACTHYSTTLVVVVVVVTGKGKNSTVHSCEVPSHSTRGYCIKYWSTGACTIVDRVIAVLLPLLPSPAAKSRSSCVIDTDTPATETQCLRFHSIFFSSKPQLEGISKKSWASG